MWKITGQDGKVVLGHDGKTYTGSSADAFFAWATLWQDEIHASPTGPVLRWPFKDDAERFLAAVVFVRETGVKAAGAVPPKGYDKYSTEDGVVY